MAPISNSNPARVGSDEFAVFIPSLPTNLALKAQVDWSEDSVSYIIAPSLLCLHLFSPLHPKLVTTVHPGECRSTIYFSCGHLPASFVLSLCFQFLPQCLIQIRLCWNNVLAHRWSARDIYFLWIWGQPFALFNCDKELVYLVWLNSVWETALKYPTADTIRLHTFLFQFLFKNSFNSKSAVSILNNLLTAYTNDKKLPYIMNPVFYIGQI